MKSTKLNLLLLLILFPFCFNASYVWALSATATVDRNEITPYETVELSVVISGDGGEVDTSVIKDFDVIFLGRSSSLRIVNTDVTRELQLKYSLSPRRRGTLTIPSLSVKDGSDVIRTNPIKINVVESAAAGGDDQVSGDILMTASVSNATPYVGQEIVYTFKFMAAVKVYKARYQKPSFEGFSVKELDDQKEYSVVQNGRRYSVTEVSYLLTPRKDGNFTIDSGLLTCEVSAPGRSRPRSLFDDPFFGRVRTITRSVSSGPVRITVSPLPEYKGKGHFSGLIGKFELSLEADPQNLSVGDSSTIALTVQGSGNIKDAPPPELSLPDAFKVYPDTPEESIDSGTVSGRIGTKGKKIFRYAIVPTKEGRFELGPFELVTFDPDAGRYLNLKAGPVSLNVVPGRDDEDMRIHFSSTKDGYEATVNSKKNKVRLTGHDILSVRSGLDVLKPARRMSVQVFILFLLLPVLVFTAAKVAGGRRRRALSPAELMCRRADSLLKQASKIINSGENKKFLRLLYRALVSAVFARADRVGESLTYEEARALLEASGSADDKKNNDKIGHIVELLTQIDSARYGGAALDEENENIFKQVRTQVKWLCSKQ